MVVSLLFQYCHLGLFVLFSAFERIATFIVLLCFASFVYVFLFYICFIILDSFYFSTSLPYRCFVIPSRWRTWVTLHTAAGCKLKLNKCYVYSSTKERCCTCVGLCGESVSIKVCAFVALVSYPPHSHTCNRFSRFIGKFRYEKQSGLCSYSIAISLLSSLFHCDFLI